MLGYISQKTNLISASAKQIGTKSKTSCIDFNALKCAYYNNNALW